MLGVALNMALCYVLFSGKYLLNDLNKKSVPAYKFNNKNTRGMAYIEN